MFWRPQRTSTVPAFEGAPEASEEAICEAGGLDPTWVSRPLCVGCQNGLRVKDGSNSDASLEEAVLEWGPSGQDWGSIWVLQGQRRCGQSPEDSVIPGHGAELNVNPGQTVRPPLSIQD